MNFSEMQDRFLIRIYHLTMRGISKGKYSLSFLSDICPETIPTSLTKKILQGLKESGLVETTDEVWNEDDGEFETVYEATAKGLGYIDQINDFFWGLKEEFKQDNVWALNVLESGKTHGNNVATHVDIPASDRIVALDHNSPDYKNTVEAVDAVINAVAGDNEYGDSTPDEKETVVTALRAGRKFLDAAEARVSALKAMLISPLQYIADNFAKGTIAALAAKAVTAVAKLLGII